MSVFQRVLFPIDLSVNVLTLSATTRRMFDRADVEVVMLHVIEEPSRSVRGFEVARAMAQMEYLANEEFHRANVTRRAERGRAADCILDYAQNHEVDVIVIPAGGFESLRRNALGHVTEEVLTYAPCAVWMEWMTGSVESARQICCSVDLAGDDESVVNSAAEIAAEFGAQLTIVHALELEPPMAVWWDTDALEQDVRLARMQVDELRQRYAPQARVHVEAGHADTVVSRILHRVNAGLLVAGRQGPSLVAAAMACPVLRVPLPMAALTVAAHHTPAVLTRSA